MIYLTGDTHGAIDICKLSTRRWPEGAGLARDDYLIVLGDFGLVWDGSASDEWWLKWLEDKPWTTLFVDGNHENHPLLATYPEREWMGGRVHEVRPHVLHLMRGNVFDMPTGDGTRSFLAMGGAASHDREWRTEGVSWWPEEVPGDDERTLCEKTLEARGWRVDYVLTHCAPASSVHKLARALGVTPRVDEYEEWLDGIGGRLSYDRWYCGHWHVNAIDERIGLEVLYDYIVPLGE